MCFNVLDYISEYLKINSGSHTSIFFLSLSSYILSGRTNELKNRWKEERIEGRIDGKENGWKEDRKTGRTDQMQLYRFLK